MRRVPWVNLWMIGFAAGGAWLIRFKGISALVILAVILLAGLLRSPNKLRRVGGVYLDAWQFLRRQRWILWLFGSLALINLIGGTVDFAVKRHYGLSSVRAQLKSGNKASVISPSEYISHHLPRSMPRALTLSPTYFYPTLNVSTGFAGGALTIMAVLLIVPWARRQLRAMPDMERFAGRMLPGLSIVLAIDMIALLFEIFAIKISYSPGFSRKDWALFGDYNMTANLGMAIWSCARYLLFVPAVLAGLSGSLQRADNNEPVAKETFFRDAVRYLKPLAGVGLITGILAVVFWFPMAAADMYDHTPHWYIVYGGIVSVFWMLYSVLLMLLPYAIVVQNKRTWEGIRLSISTWFTHFRDVISFVAIGVTGITIFMLARNAITEWDPFYSWLSVATSTIFTSLTTLLYAYMAVAVWEFYQLISKGETVEHSEA